MHSTKYFHTFNRLLAIILLIPFASCLVWTREAPSPAPNIQTSRKITLIGFCPFEESKEGNYRYARLNRDNCFRKDLGYGRSVFDIPYGGANRNIPPAKVKAFLEAYLEEVRKSGIEEIAPLIIEKGEDLYLRQNDTDYYVMGIHGPPWGATSENGHILNAFASMFTLMTIPHYGGPRVESKYMIFDANLNKIHETEIKSDIATLSAWWLYPFADATDGDEVEAMGYRVDNEHFSVELQEFLKSR